MTFEALNRNLKQARMQRTILFVFVIVSMLTNVMLSVSLTRTARTTVLVPTNIRDGMVAAGAVDKRFVEALAKDAVFAFYTTTPNTTEYGRTVVERIASLRDRPELLKTYDAVSRDLSIRDISTVFFTQRIDHFPDHLRVRIEGSFATYIGESLVSRVPRSVDVFFVEETNSVRLSKIVAYTDGEAL